MSALRVPPQSRALEGQWLTAPHSFLPKLRGPEHVLCLSRVSPWPGPTSGLHQSALWTFPAPCSPRARGLVAVVFPGRICDS